MFVVVYGLLTILGMTVNGVISRVLLQNKFVQIASPVSMEMYLCHMFVFRVLERSGLIHLTGNEAVNYTIIVVVTILGSIITAVILKEIIKRLNKKIRLA